MFVHILLGLLRDGDPHHGYQLMSEYKARSGNQASAGSFYRVLARLAHQGLISTGSGLYLPGAFAAASWSASS